MELSSLVSLINESLNFVREHPEFTCFVVFLWSFLETALLLGLLLPAEKVLILTSVLAAKGIVSPFHFVMCGTFGTFLGYTASYFMGYYLGEELLKKLLLKFNLSEEDYLRAKEFVERKGELSLLFGRFLPVVRPLLPVVIGAFKPSFLKFTLFNLGGALIWMLSYVLFGNLIGEAFSIIIRHKLLALVALLFSLLLYLLWRSYGKNRKEL